MDRNKNSYTFIYASVMVALVAGILSWVALALKPAQQLNVDTETKQNILAAANEHVSAADADRIYGDKITAAYVVNSKGAKVDGDAFALCGQMKKQHALPEAERRLPVFEFKGTEGTKYIFPLYGAGLWGPIWGYIALNDDMSTIYGANFSHQSETPGLGAEISTEKFQAQFKGKNIFEGETLCSITVAKSNESAPAEYRVDAISGGTLTSKGLQAMLLSDLKSYEAFLKNHKSEEK